MLQEHNNNTINDNNNDDDDEYFEKSLISNELKERKETEDRKEYCIDVDKKKTAYNLRLWEVA